MRAQDAFDWLARGTGQYDREDVTQLEHALQTAALAVEDGATPALVLAALFHDLGHLLVPNAEAASVEGRDLRHERIGAAYLARTFGPAVSEPVRLHVHAKRYLARDPAYRATLSAESTRSLALQGGPMTAFEAHGFLSDPHALARDSAAALGRRGQGRRPAGARPRSLPGPRSRACFSAGPSHPLEAADWGTGMDAVLRIRQSLSRAHPILFTIYAVVAAFSTYFCMYAYRKPFAAASYEGGLELPGLGLVDYKVLFIISQVFGYCLSKFIGIKVVSELPHRHRALAILVCIGIAQLGLVGFGLLPTPINAIGLFVNGLPLGMVWGLVFGFLEGRRTSDLLGAGLCASFIVASGFVKSVGLGVLGAGVPETWMPAVVGRCDLHRPPVDLGRAVVS